MSSPSLLRVGVIGVGNIGSAHAAALAEGKVSLLTLGALCDNDPARARELRRLYPNVPIYEDAEELMASGTVAAVVIATPHYSHPRLALRAFAHGLHVLSEKPVGVYCAQVREAVDVARREGKVYAVMFNQRTDKLFRQARELVRSGAIGDIKRSVWIITNWYRKQCYYDSGDWRATWSGEGGGVLMNQAPHNLDLWQWICGMPTEVRAVCPVGKFHTVEVEDEATLFTQYENGATGVFITSTGDLPGTNRLEIVGTRGSLVLEKKKLTFTRLLTDERAYCLSPAEEQIQTETVVWEDEPYEGHLRVLENFGRAVLYGEEPVATAEEALRELTLCNAAYLSAWQGRPVSLPLDDAEYWQALRERIARSEHANHAASVLSDMDTEYLSRWNTNW